MAQANTGATGANEAVPLMEGAGARVAGQAAALVAGPPIAAVAGPPFPQGLVHARFDMDGVLLGPLPTKSNGSCKILPKIVGETWP